ncbi:choice-of-anchor Q domain-containing protein [Gimesia algae]|uniref:Probable pectate lyase C n=1 Tax=Gimesia algae TaxID=2527971 RepID=A0A517VIQ1_9PLAN|nr:choice-of-anchor Q domain-containing protein [Gimesia algae]QDT92883.1 putative outer membrane protein PmpB precursor [Gimesia algae]
MLLTSWVESMRVAFEKSRKATLNPRRRLQLRSVPSSARQKVQRRIAIEQLEDRTLLTSLIINQLTAGLGMTIDNSVLDPDDDGFSNYDSIIFEDLTVNATSGAGISIDLDGLQFQNDDHTEDVPFSILFDNVTVNAAAGRGIDIDLDGLLAESISIAVDSSTITGAVGNAFNIDLTDIVINEFNIVDSTLSGQSGAGVTVAMSNTIIDETSIRRSNIDGVSIDVADESNLRNTTLADNTIAGTSGNDGVSVNIVDSEAEELRLTNNNSIQGVSITVDDTAAEGAALLTELFIHSNVITGNTAGAGVSLNLNNVDQFVSITGNSITSNSGHGIVFDQTDGDLSGEIGDNLISGNTGHGIFFTPSTTNPVPTGASPGVPANPGVPGGPTDRIDFAAPRNEVQVVSFAGSAIGGFFQLQYTDNRGNSYTTDDIAHTATAAQVKAFLVALDSDIEVDDIQVNGNFTDGYEIEFVNDLAHQNINPLEVVNADLTFDNPTVTIFQDSIQDLFYQRASEVQVLTFDNVPTFGTYTLFFLGQSTTLNWDDDASAVEDALNDLAANLYPSMPADFKFVTVELTGVGFEVTVVDDPGNPLAYINIDQIIPNANGLNYDITITEQRAGTATLNEQQLLEFDYVNLPVGQQFILSLGSTSTAPITIVNSSAAMITSIDAALEAAGFGTTGTDFTVTGNFINGFVIEFTGDLEETNHALFQIALPPGTDITITASTTTQGSGRNEIQAIEFPAQPGGGDFTISLDTETTVPLAYDATAADVQLALEGLTNIGPGNVLVTKSSFGNSFIFLVEFVGSNSLRPADFENEPLGTLLTIDDDGLIAAVPTVTTVSEGTSLNEVQEVVVNGTPTAGDFKLSFDGVETTGVINFNDDAADILTQLNTIPVLNGNVLVRGDVTNGFEIEFIGELANTNPPQIAVTAVNLTGATLSVKTTTVGGYLRGISGNTITGNSGAGIEIDLEMYTSFYGDITGNTISSNDTQGINLNAADPTTLVSIDFSLSVEDNTLDANQGAAIAVSMEDTATGDVSITGNTITNTRNDLNAATPYTGDAIYVDLYGTDVHFEAFNQLRDLIIDGNYIGIDADSTAGLGNAGNGIGIHIEESTIIDYTQISNNVIMNNTGDGVHFHREDDARVGRADVDPIVGEERAVKIYSNMISGNSDGIDILAQNGSLTTTDFEIKDNVLSSNARDGIKMHAEADALIFADIINNEINTNSLNGIESTSYSSNYAGTDKRDVAGTWMQNTISNNSQHGIDISGRIGNHEMLFIGLNGVDPVTGADRGNLISGNGRDGIQIAATVDRIDGRVRIANNQILSNSTGGIELTGAGLRSSIDNNLIASNTGKGIDINSDSQVSFIRGNIITENTLDGLEILSANRVSPSEVGNNFTEFGPQQPTTSVTAIGNFIDNNGGRGVDLQTEDRANSDFIFGDGTEAGANHIVSNGLEGFYVVTTASVGQDQDAASTATLDATGSVVDSDADMVLQINTNYIQDNGVNSNFTTTGLVLRIGTMNSIWGGGTFWSSTQRPSSDNGGAAVGDEDSANAANGRSNVMVTGNVFEGNYGEDVYAESFVSTVDPNITSDVWTSPASNPNFRVLSSYERDPLARLNLFFEENTGNGLDVTNFGAYYDTAEPVFKSRLNNYTAPVPDGDFTSATRRRNAQRIASRAGYDPTIEPSPNGPPDSGNVIGASIDPVSGRILIQADDVSLLANGYAIEITRSLRATDGYDANPIYGLFTIADIDYNANTFTLVSTEGYDLTGYSTTGFWSTNDNTASFVFDGVGVSTFRVNQTYFNNSFDDYTSNFFNSVILGGGVGEIDFAWDFWNPDVDTFLAPFVQTFMTADISVTTPDPLNHTFPGDFIVSFTEDVSDLAVTLSDFALYHNNALVNDFYSLANLEQLTPRTFRLNIDTLLGGLADGEYELRLNADGSITDIKYSDSYNTLLFGDVERFTIDTAAPTVQIENVSPDPRSAAVGDLIVNFSEDVTGVDLGDFTLVGPNDSVNLAATPATLTQVTGSQFVLDLSKVTNLSGTYTLSINSTASSFIVDSAGNALTTDSDSVEDVSWVNDTQAPTATFDPFETTDGTVDIEFDNDVTGLDVDDFKLFRGGDDITDTIEDMSVVVKTIVSVVSIAGSDSAYKVTIHADYLSANGEYRLVFVGEGSGVTDDAGNEAVSSSDVKWNQGTDFTAPIAGIQDVIPDPETSLVYDVMINFSEDVTGVDILDFELWIDKGNGPEEIDISGLMLTEENSSTYTIDLSTVTNVDGEYTLKLIAAGSGIVDLSSNALVSGASETWRIGGPKLGASIQGIEDDEVIHTNAGVVSINFEDVPVLDNVDPNPVAVDVADVTISDFRLTLNGQAIDLAAAGVTVTAVNPVIGGTTTTASLFTLDLTQVTQATGSYVLTLVAEGSEIIDINDNPLLVNASKAWTNSSTIDLTGIDPTTVDDAVDTNVGDGIVADENGNITLRAAIQEANALAGSNVIQLAAGTYLLDIAGIDEDQSATGDLDIRDNLTIRGQGVGVTIIDGGALDRIFQIFAGVTLNLENLTIQNGRLTGSDDGAGIRNSGTTTLTNVEVTENVAEDGGGGINNTGLMVIVDSTISNNTAGGSGGGLRNTGTLQISRSTISENTTERDGGAVFNAGIGTVTVSNSTFSGNSSDRSGGAIRNTATLNATNNTMTLNDAGTAGGAVANSGTATMQNNLVIANTATTNSELDGSFTSLGGNLTGVIGTATGFGFGDIINVADPTPVLDLNLADNGGPTLTHALLLGSIAIDTGVNTNTATLEQRGSSRILGTNVDIGAVEYGTFFVNSTEDTVDINPGDGIVADENGNISLRAAIMEANALAGDSVIILGAGEYNLSLLGSGENSSETGDLDITDTTGSLTILGAGSGQTTINAAGLTDERDRVFDIFSGADLTLQGVMITGGKVIGDSGGGIRNVGTLTLINSLVDGNAAEVDVDDTTAVVNGGGILNGQLGLQGTLTLTNSDVTNNSAVDGGGIFNNDQSVITIVDSEISGNTASSDGGGLFNDLQATVDILRSSISGNTSTEDGGGIYNNDLASVTITDSKVNNNMADQGGGIFNEEAASLTITRTTVSGNTASQDGGGIYNDEGVVSLNTVSLLLNTAAFDGGGLYNGSAGEVTITTGMFDDNSAGRDGGAIANFGISLSLSGTIVRDSNAVRNGGGLFNDQEEGTVSLINASFINNEADSGGAIYNQELGVIDLDLSDLLNNTASENGGGIFNTADATITVRRTTVDGNVASNGAGIYNEDIAQLNLINSTVSNNVATGDGGGLFNNSLVLANIENATISGNAAINGAGIFNGDEGTMEITNATITNNAGTTGGGIINEDGGLVSVVNTIIAGNSATGTGVDVAGEYNSIGFNLIGDDTDSTGFIHSTDKVDVASAGLGNLQDNGGATFTHELLGGSLARDAGNNFYAPTNDQRGFARLFDGDGDGTLVVDIGAFESGYIVTSFKDSVDAVPGDGVSVDSQGRSTLRAAIIEANAHAGADTILLGSGTYTLSLFGLGENGALLGDLDITDDLTIIGAGSERTFIDADFLDRIFHIFTDVNVTIRGVTLVNGSVTRVEDGGAILNFGNLILEDVTIENGLANRGGALFNNGIVTMTDSLFENNTAIADGGAIFNSDYGTITIDLSTISGNDAENGGGIYNSTGGTLAVNDTTIDGNTATVAGGGVFISDEVAVGNGEGNASSSTGAQYQGEVVVVEEYEAHSIPKYNNGDSEIALLSEAPPFPVSDTFNLSSLPGSNFTIYLDFDGHTTTGTQWNTAFGTIVTPAYDTDGNVGSFSLAEIEVIQRTWLRVAEDFAPFNVNVTTAEPPVSDLIRTDGSDTRWGVRVVIGENTWYSNAGGVAYVGSFNDNLDTPTYVFNTGLIGVAEAASHEVGHTLGLFHDGTSTEEYYFGHGSGPTGWAPIMGAGYSQDLVQWSQGEYTDADNSEDDLNIITTQNGFSYRVDDYGSSIGTASSLINGTASGIIERNTDVDFFQFTTTGGDAIIDPFFESPNLDILATLYDSSGTQIQTSNPIGALNASFTGLAAGTYYVSIEGTGEGDVLGTGYSDYGSLGQYTITVTGLPPTVDVVGHVTISNSTISHNFAGTRGGGLLNEDTVDISNVTFSGNEAGKEGGAIHNTGEMTINNTTVYENSTEGTGGGIYSVADTASVSVKNTIVAGNNALLGGFDLAGTFTSLGYNLIGTSGSAAGFIDGFNGDIVGSNSQRIDPALTALLDNGGPTETHALLAGSRAIDAGDNTDGISLDQRGATRPTDTTSDIGAFEIVTPTISISDVSQLETDITDGTVMKFIVSLSNSNVDDVTVDFETSNISATAGVDYQFTTGTVTFVAGETTQVIEVLVYGDTVPEFHETFTVNLYNASGAVIGTPHGTGTIQNDEAILSIKEDISVDEGPQGTITNMDFTVTLSHPLTESVSVDFVSLITDSSETLGDAYADGDDFSISTQNITFLPGDTEVVVSVEIVGDSLIEEDEVFRVELQNIEVKPVSGSGNVSITINDVDIQAIGTITNDDEAFLSISDATMVEPEDGTGPVKMRFAVTLSHPAPTGGVTVNYETSDGIGGSGALAGSDYTADSGSISIDEDERMAFIEIDILDDVDGMTDAELTEYFTLKIISAEVTATAEAVPLSDDTAVGTIIEAGQGLVVTTTDDELDVDDTDAGYDRDDLSLREAIQIINNNIGGYHTIILNQDDYVMSIAGINENNNGTGDYDIKRDMTIVGEGAGLTIIDAANLDRIFHTQSDVTLNLSGMSLINGDADDGGAIFAEGDTNLNQIIFQDNSASFLGGAIVSLGQLDITNAQFLNNHAGFQGGAIYQYTETATVSRTTFSENSSDGRAGAVYVASDASFDVSQSLFYANDAGSRGGAIFNEGTITSTNVTFSGNHAGSRGGAIFNTGSLSVLNNTLTKNTADQSGGGISNDTGAFATLSNTIVAENSGFFANPDLGGAYDTTSSFNNLIGDIGTATGLTDDSMYGNLVGTQEAPIDPKLGDLLDNGGPTLTHSLLFGSLALDAGKDSDLSFNAPAVDQRGYERPKSQVTDGTPHVDIGAVEVQNILVDPNPDEGAPLFGTGGDASLVDENTSIQISVVKQKTGVSSNGHTAALPGNEDWLQEWDSFWVEVWVDTASGFGISDVLTDIAYNTAYFTATSVEFGSNFTFNKTVVIDDAAGVVRNLGGSTSKAYVGGTGYALLARIKFESLAGDQVEVDPTDLTIEPQKLGLDIQNAIIDISGIGEVSVNVGALPETDLYPVIYDIDDNDKIDYRDLIFFTSAYNQKVFNATSPYASALDFDKSGKVDYRDLISLAGNYGKKKSGNTEVTFPVNFGQKWVGNQLEVASGDDSIDQVIEAAVDTWETALGVEDLDVQVVVHDFGTAQLGSGLTTEYSVDGVPVGGRVVIDNDANGLGWHVDVTDLPSGSAYDLYTVLLHEIGHVLGFTRYFSGFGSLVEESGGNLVFVGSDFTVALDSTGLHVDDPAYADDLMGDTLDPGIRKTISDVNVQMLLEAYANAQSGSASGGAAPIFGTNNVPAEEIAEPVLIQSQGAAQTFIEQSSMSLVAPAVIKSTEEEDSNAGIQQTVTFDVFQPSVSSDPQVADEFELDTSLFEDLYSSSEFEDTLMDSDTDDRHLVFAHADDEQEWDLADDFNGEQEAMDDAFTNWEGPLL